MKKLFFESVLDARQQLRIGFLAAARNRFAPLIIAAAWDLEHPAQELDGVLRRKLLYHGIPFCGGSWESMPRDFFRISLSWRAMASSFLSRRFSSSSTE